jgi:hypothetical protein
MATIKFRRGSGQPTGLTAYEPAWDSTNNRFFINNGSTALWVGAAIDTSTTLSGNCAYTLPTQNAVKTYVDNQIASGLCSGAVASLNGATGAITIAGSTGITITTSTAARGITVSINSDVATRTGGNTFTGIQVFTSGLSAGSLTELNQLWIKGGLTVGDRSVFTGAARFDSGVSFQNNLQISGTVTAANTTLGIIGGVCVSNDSTFLKNVNITETLNTTGRINAIGGISSAGGTFAGLLNINNLYVNGGSTFAGSIDILGGLNAKGATFTNIYASNIVSSVDGVTGAVDLLAGSGISITLPTGTAKGITLANTGVLSIASGNTAISFNASTGAVTGTFNGVHTVAGTANQITASSSTGSVTFSLPSAVTMPGSLTVTGDLTVNGTTTTVNSTTVTVQDPLIAIGGVTGNAPPPVGDTKDRGILFQWATGVTGQTGFFGFDQSAQRFTFIPNGASVTGEIVTGVAGNANLLGVYSPHGTLTLQGTSAGNATITVSGGTGDTSSGITHTAYEHAFTSAAGLGRIALRGDSIDPTLKGIFVTPTFTATRTYTVPNWSGQMGVWATAPLQGRILLGDVSGSAPYWADPTSSGFTAYAATNAENLRLTATSSNTNFNLTFAIGNSGYQAQYADISNNLTWNPSTQTLTAASGAGKFEGVVDGGGF